eukprot:scaffold8966_cov73-Cylindrotheca_fusiformis.AAC.2
MVWLVSDTLYLSGYSSQKRCETLTSSIDINIEICTVHKDRVKYCSASYTGQHILLCNNEVLPYNPGKGKKPNNRKFLIICSAADLKQ